MAYINVLTKQKLSPHLKDLFIERIGEVENNHCKTKARYNPRVLIPPMSMQAPSTQKLLDQIAQDTGSPIPINAIAQTPAAAAPALQSRDAAINKAGIKLSRAEQAPGSFNTTLVEE